MCKARQMLHSVTLMLLLLLRHSHAAPGMTAFLSKKHMTGKHWGFYEPFFCALAKYTEVITWKTQVLELLPFL